MPAVPARPARTAAWGVLLAVLFTALAWLLLYRLLGIPALAGLHASLVAPWQNAAQAVAWQAFLLSLLALGLAYCFRANVWNIGAEGQWIVGMLAAVAAGQQVLHWPAQAAMPAMLCAGALAGMGWAAIVALLRTRFHANEIVLSLMLVYIASQVSSALALANWRGSFPPDASTAPTATLGYLGLTALAAALLGTRLAHAGWHNTFTRHARMAAHPDPLAPMIWRTLLCCGALAGLAAAWTMVYTPQTLLASSSTGLGFVAIMVAYVGRLHPLGCVLAALLFATARAGCAGLVESLGLPKEVSALFIGALLCASMAAYAVAARHEEPR